MQNGQKRLGPPSPSTTITTKKGGGKQQHLTNKKKLPQSVPRKITEYRLRLQALELEMEACFFFEK
jgi:hypothetical protein